MSRPVAAPCVQRPWPPRRLWHSPARPGPMASPPTAGSGFWAAMTISVLIVALPRGAIAVVRSWALAPTAQHPPSNGAPHCAWVKSSATHLQAELARRILAGGSVFGGICPAAGSDPRTSHIPAPLGGATAARGGRACTTRSTFLSNSLRATNQGRARPRRAPPFS